MERNIILVVVAIVALAFGAVIWWKQQQTPTPATSPLPAQQSSPAAQEQPRVPEPAPEVDTPEPVEAPLPMLDDADETVRSEVLAASGEGSALGTWLEQDDLVRRFAV